MTQRIAYKEALEIMNSQTNSQLISSVSEKHIKLPPKYLSNVKTGLKEQLNLMMSLFDTKLNGVPIAYTGIKLLQRLGRVVSDQSCVHLDIVAEFIVFQPHIGCTLEGIVNKVGKHHVGCLVHNCFNAWLPLTGALREWDGEKDRLLGRPVTFNVTTIFTNNDILSMKGMVVACSLAELRSPDKQIRKKTSFTTDDVDNPPVHHSSSGMPSDPEIETELELEPLFSSTQIGDISSATLDGDSMTKLKTKSKKRKRNKKSVGDVSFEIDKKQTDIDDSSSIDSSMVQSVLSSRASHVDMWQHTKKKKKKKDKHKESNRSIDDEYDVSRDLTDGSKAHNADVDMSSERKRHKKKRKESKHDKYVDSSNAVADIQDTTGNGVDLETSETTSSSKKKSKKKDKHSKRDISLDGMSVSTDNQYTQGAYDQLDTPTRSKKQRQKHKTSNAEMITKDHAVIETFLGVDHQHRPRKHKMGDDSNALDSGISSPKRRMWDTSNYDNNNCRKDGDGSVKKHKKRKSSRPIE